MTARRLDVDNEGAAWDMLVGPFDHNHMLAAFLNGVGDGKLVQSNVLDNHLVARLRWSTDADKQHLIACRVREERLAQRLTRWAASQRVGGSNPEPNRKM